MKKYIKPVTECVEGTLQLPLMLSLIDEVGDGQLSNSYDFDEDDSPLTSPKGNDHLSIGF
ncbi:MAG: hypothetical protein IKH88_15200 [Prevotella sp.]|nr:hypothetical protein [Prevotella sp.]